MPTKRIALLAGAIIVATVVAVVVVRRSGLPTPGSQAYEQVTRAFYHGLAALEVGLLDDARTQFTRATELVPEEPASWANLAVAQLRLGELDLAAEPVAQALALEPDHADLLTLAARMEMARGRIDEGIAHLRRAAELDQDGLRARFALAEEVERSGAPGAEAEALAMLDALVDRAPGNAAVLLERARVAARASDAPRLANSIERLAPLVPAWPEMVGEQFTALQGASVAGDFALAGRSTLLMRNLLAPVPTFRESLAAVRTPTELVAEPLDRFVRLASPPATPSPADDSLRFDREVSGAVPETLRRIAAGASPIDWNNDFRTDFATADGSAVRLATQTEAGGFDEVSIAACACTAAWAADIEMDGDLDLVAATSGEPMLLRNNGDGTWLVQPAFREVRGATAFAWADLDGDADPDAAFVDASGRLFVYVNRQAGDFALSDAPGEGVRALTAADGNADGVIELLTLTRDGVRRVSRQAGEWRAEVVTSSAPESPSAAAVRLLVADLDNNGAQDLIISGRTLSTVWLGDEQHRVTFTSQLLNSEATSVADLNEDGLLDIVARTDDGVIRYLTRGSANYHWKSISPRATTATGDQRINSFGVGGDIQVRSGLLVQKQVLTGGPAHFGLGDQTAIDVARIVWPNGVAQAEFGVDVDNELVAEQRLKGSCPWVFAWDGETMAFVTDFLWRSPLGLRINAQDTAGVVQTEDWVRIRGDQLRPRDGLYDVRITAELWETHFFDHVSLMAVDHPAGTEVYVDERFSAARPPEYTVHTVRNVTPVRDARDHRGRDVSDLVASRDGRYLATFARGRYQGIAEEHFVEFGPPEGGPHENQGKGAAPFVRSRGGRLQAARNLLIASGWIYPTDSSINVAIAQAGIQPRGLTLEAQGIDGQWRVVDADLGFPAGKNKTILIDLSRVEDAARLRLRTNLEIYWDSLALAELADAEIQTTRLAASSAELRYRGFSQTTSLRDEAPETPDYARLASGTQRWRDLEGYHTRFGDVAPLLAAVDDRYVIMNAGDEMRLTFPEEPAPRAGWTRDFVLIGDGWEKDGDYNTGFSQTVLPLPAHDTPNYGATVTSLRLQDDPVYRKHRADWDVYHTRYVAPERFTRGLIR